MEGVIPVERISHWVGGKVVAGESGRTGPVFNPATGQQTHEVDFATTEEMDTAVATAAEAFPAWRATSLSKRADILFRIRELLEQRKPELARIVTSQHGKVLSDAAGEIQRGIENIEYACGIPNLMKGGFSEQVATGVDTYSIRQPLGVVAGITPFNFPAMVPMWMFANAIACGTRSSEALGEGRAPRCSWRRCCRRRACPTACSTWCRRQVAVDAIWHTRHRGGFVRRVDTDRAIHL
jgi:malonate-semialdehyde dehydrogenase (acetylating)/methylmalonate-semialdehyde dehydrogenase